MNGFWKIIEYENPKHNRKEKRCGSIYMCIPCTPGVHPSGF